jgi:hypothetical protein
MIPFIVKYSIRDLNQESVSNDKFVYDSNCELSIFATTNQLAIEKSDFVVEYTGSIVTKADTDPTSDEQSDR